MNGDERGLPAPQRTSTLTRSSSNASSKPTNTRQNSENWEVMEEPLENRRASLDLERQEGYLLKKRKWPLKGWHKRYFILEKGILKYAKTQQDILRGKLHGSINIGLSVMSINKKSKRIDLDAEENLYHLKVKSQDVFSTWVSKLCYHRLFQKGDPVKVPYGANGYNFSISPTAEFLSASTILPLCSKPQKSDAFSGDIFKGNGHLPAGGQAVTAPWMQPSEEWDQCAKDLSQCQSNLGELNKLLQKLEVVDRVHSAPVIGDVQGFLADKPKKEKRSSKIWCTQSFAKDETKAASDVIRSAKLHVSTPSLPDSLDWKSVSVPLTIKEDYFQLQQDFCSASQKVHSSLKSLFNTLAIEREKLKQLWLEKELDPAAPAIQITNLKNTLSEVMSQNADLRNRLHRIQCLSSFTDVVTDPLSPVKAEEVACHRSLAHQLSLDSNASLSESHVEFFDAEDVLLSACSSDNEMSDDDDSTTSEITNSNSEENLDTVDVSIQELTAAEPPSCSSVDGIQRRTCLPAAGPNLSNVSLWNVLKNNIGKDLSKVSMPVQLNEPLNTLQRLCEELEFSQLLDTASRTSDPFERMIYIAAFAVSGYASAYYRARSKPFNPVLGETYECIREDKGFQFIGEQVSHHPPVSVCHAESENFLFWQDVRWKNKFWGKSLEIVPVGMVNVSLPKFGEHYQWNKITSCIHNILSGQRWIEHYGEVTITNLKSSSCHCRLTFCKTKYWSSNVNEVHGSVMDQSGRVIRQLFGKWHEGIFCGGPQSAKCIWKPNPVPKDHENYYGFTTFARELNELTPDLKRVLPLTDTRLRPDQRYLEEGNTEAAEVHKQRVEQLQRDRRRIMEENNMVYLSRFFTKTIDGSGKESWMSNGTYWELRRDPGYSKVDNPVLW